MEFLSNPITNTLIIPYKTSAYNCGILAPNGNIYFIPNNQTTVLRENVYTLTEDNTSIVLSNSINFTDGWKSGVLCPNGKIYCPPAESTSFLILNINDNSIDTTTITIPGLSTGVIKWGGSCIDPNGTMYCTPVDETRVLTVDTNTNIYDLTSFVLDRGGYYSCCYSSTVNKIYAPPGDTSNGNILSIDLNLPKSCDTTSVKLSGAYESIVASSNGKLYCAPFTLPVVSGSIGIITPTVGPNTVTDSTSIRLPKGNTSLNYNYKYRGLMSSPDGNLYYLPGSQTMVVMINPNTRKVDSTSLGMKFYQFDVIEPF